MKTCHGCNAPITSRRKWCSERCRLATFRREHPEYEQRRAEQVRKPRKPRRAVHGRVSEYQQGCRCAECAEAVRLKARSYYRQRAAQGNPISWRRIMKTCGYCSRTFEGQPKSEYCSVSCGNQARNVRTAAARAAQCSSRAARDAKRAAHARAQRRLDRSAKGNASRTAAWVTLRCVICTASFTTKWKTAEANEVTCSPTCQAANERHRTRLARDRRRARKKDAYVADVYRMKVYDRDGWKCHLCGKAVNRKAKVPHPKAPTIDHVIPLAAGGTHEPLNCRTAHFLCNAVKSDRGGGEQLLLIA